MGELEQTVTRAQDGDRAALEAVVAAVQRDVYALSLRFLWRPEDAEDATQEILVRVVTHLGSFQGRSRFRTWVYRVSVNDRQNLHFATNVSDAKRFPQVLAAIRGLEETRRAAALYRSHPRPDLRAELAPRLRELLTHELPREGPE